MAELQRTNRAVEEARAAADAANLSKTRFLAAASHDLLQPLNAARLFLSALAETELPENAERLVENVELAFESIDRLLSALLDISKLDAGVVTPEIANVQLGPLLRRLVAELAPLAERKGLTLRYVPTTAVVVTDQGMLSRALMNLMSNAIRYTRQGGVLIGVRRHGSQVRVEVVELGDRNPEPPARRDLRGVPPARCRRGAARPRLRLGSGDRRADRAHAQASVECAVGTGPRLAVHARPTSWLLRFDAVGDARPHG